MSDGAIRAAVGHGGRSLGDIRAMCGAASECGGCRPLVQEVLDEALADGVSVSLRFAGVR